MTEPAERMARLTAERVELRIELTDDERKASDDVAILVRIDAQKYVTFMSEWNQNDETYSDGHVVEIPPRIWAIALRWITENLKD